MITLKEIQDARKNLAPFIHKTPLLYSSSLSNLSGAEVYLKLENIQKTGSFKVRGAFNKMCHVREERVIAASMGNHAQAVAFAAQKLGKRAQIIMPLIAQLVKEEATKGYGAEVKLVGERFSEALEYALSQKGSIFIHPFDDDLVIAGQGTIGIEIHEDLNEIDAVFVPVGGGGLIAGVATALKALSPGTAIIGVQAESAPAATVSFKDEKIGDRIPHPTIADGIAVNKPGEKTFELIMRCVDDMVLTSEESIAMSILLFLERKKLVVEGAGAAPLAALLDKRTHYRSKRVVLVVSGGNIDFSIIDRIIRKGMKTSGRIGILEVTIDDIAGSLHKITGILAAHRANVLDIIHDRFAGALPYGKAKVIVTMEIRSKQYFEEITTDLESHGYEASERTGI
jgi:threonine dehydratase